jgi:hypothetical protein
MDNLIYIFEHIDWGLGYIVTLIIFLLFALLSEIYKTNIFMYFFIAYLILFSSTRDIVNYDMENYKMWYENYQSLTPSFIEPLFITLSYIFHYFTDSPYLLFFFYSFFNILLVFIAMKNLTTYTKTSFYIFLTIPMLYLGTLIGIRQRLAEAIIFFAVSILYKDKKHSLFWFVILGILAFFSHYSAIVAVLVILLTYFTLKNRIYLKLYTMLIFLTLILNILDINRFLILNFLSLLLPYIPEKYQIYSQALSTEGKTVLPGFSIYTILLFNILSLISIYAMTRLLKNKEISENYGLIINILFVGTIYANLFGKFADVTGRIFYYFIYYYSIFIPFILYKFFRLFERVILVYFISIFLFFWLLWGVYKKIEQNEPPPMIYRNILLKNIF